MNYLVNFILVLFKNIPGNWRGAPFMQLVATVGKALNRMNRQWVNTISHTGQVASMEHYLNMSYSLPYTIATRTDDIAAQAIIWISGSVSRRRFLYNKMEMKQPMYLRQKAENAPVYLRNKSEAAQYDYTVFVPASLSFDINQLKAMVDTYNIAGKRYTIQTY